MQCTFFSAVWAPLQEFIPDGDLLPLPHTRTQSLAQGAQDSNLPDQKTYLWLYAEACARHEESVSDTL